MKGIYKITSPSGRIYIGQSGNLEKRKKYYTPGRCKNQRLINNSLRKYGYKNHIFEVVHELPNDIEQEVLDRYEVLYFQQYKDLGFKMMNLKDCGNGGGKHSQETKDIIGEQSKKRFKAKEGYEIYQYDKNLVLVKVWKDSILDISKMNNFLSPSITRSLNRNETGDFKMAHDFFWFYKKDIDKIEVIDKDKIIEAGNQFGKCYKYWNPKQALLAQRQSISFPN